MTAYRTWPQTMPPLFASILAAIEVSHLFDRPFLVDDSDLRDTFGLTSSTLREAPAE
ncbi:hypothetical protein ACFV4P_12185 [Kitasatospora sp. NPDC059795]|uniref:hypothetical protein n=1 Tax=Kitasatospora sp. NPDC059795 TaxID=3346949 RepID=UPI003668D7D0